MSIFMHPKRKGNIGQFAVATKLSEYGFSIFTEEGDISKIDLIAEKDNKIYTFQIKSITPKNGVLPLRLRKCGPNYLFKYNVNMFDFFGVYDLKNKNIYIIPSNILLELDAEYSLRLIPPKNNMTKHIRYAEEFLADKVLTKIGPSGIEPESVN